MTPEDDYSARVIAYVERHGWPALLRHWVAKNKALPENREAVDSHYRALALQAEAAQVMREAA